MKSIFKSLLAVMTLCVLMTSCDGDATYSYLVSNKSSQDIYLILYPYEGQIYDYDYDSPNLLPFYESNNGFSYLVTYVGNEETEVNCPLEWVRLQSGESIKFTIGNSNLFINENPESKWSYAIWLRKNCIQKILIGDNFAQSGEAPVCNEQLSSKYWSKSSNWIIQNKKSDYIEYWLVIDDEVIRDHSVPTD